MFPVLIPVRAFDCRRQIESEFVALALTRNMGFVHGAENLENRKFHGKFELRSRSGLKIRRGSSLARISLPRGAPRVITSDS